jgi:hypothetical protein
MEELALFRRLLPGRCLEQGLRVLLQGFSLMTEGGVLAFEGVAKQELAKSGKQEIGEKDRKPIGGMDGVPIGVGKGSLRVVAGDDTEEMKELEELLVEDEVEEADAVEDEATAEEVKAPVLESIAENPQLGEAKAPVLEW